MTQHTEQNLPVELAFESDSKAPSDAELDCIFYEPGGEERRVPAFRSSDGSWRVRYASPVVGLHLFETRSTSQERVSGSVQIHPYQGRNPLFAHGPLRIADDRRHLCHADGAPFFWLADTWWMACTKRLEWPGDFQGLVADRVAKGFSVIQLVAGFYPEMALFAAEGDAHAGWPWSEGFKDINVDWWDEADLKLWWLVSRGLVPCVFGAWGYYIKWTGTETMKRHWRNIIARWGAYPVVWSIAGEVAMPYYDDMGPLFDPDPSGIRAETLEKLKLIAGRAADSGPHEQSRNPSDELVYMGLRQADQWVEVARTIRDLDPWHRLLTAHPVVPLSSFEMLRDSNLYDFEMLQTGHTDRVCFESTFRTLREAMSRQPVKPVINGEVCYEGIMGSSWHDTQRFLFWSHMLSGAAGHSYGAQGLWSFTPAGYFGQVAVPWGATVWHESAAQPGSTHVGIGRRILESFEWQRFEAHPEWVEPHWTPDSVYGPFAAGIPGEVRVIYFPPLAFVGNPQGLTPMAFSRVRIRSLEPGRWVSRFVNPRTGEALPERTVEPDAKGDWILRGDMISATPTKEDWVLIVQRS